MANPVNNAVTYADPGARPTCKAIGAAVIGSRFVKVVPGGENGQRPGIANGTADCRVYGVSQNDVPQNGYVLVNRVLSVSVKAGVALAAGDEVFSDATGQAIKTGTRAAGICTADTASGALAPIQLF